MLSSEASWFDGACVFGWRADERDFRAAQIDEEMITDVDRAKLLSWSSWLNLYHKISGRGSKVL
jgi:hypothetical protein